MENLTRRRWIKTSLGITSGVAFSPFLIDKLIAHPMNKMEEAYFQQLPVAIKTRLNANENPYGPSDRAKAAIREILPEANRYPIAIVTELKKAIAARERVPIEYIAVGAGSSEMLCATGAAFGLEGGGILSPYPTFPLLMNYAEVVKARWDKVNVNDELIVDYDELSSQIKSDTKLVFVCNPNNPTGTAVGADVLKNFCLDVSKKVPVYIDEAYLEFLEPARQISMVELVKNDYDVIVSKTFSKIYGLAGMRIGYIIAKPDLIKKISKYQISFSTSQTAVAAAKASLGDEAFMNMTRTKNAAARKILTDWLDKNGYFYGKSFTNFVFFDARGNAKKFLDKLAQKEIGIRVWDFNGKTWNRISVGTAEEMKLLIKYLDEIQAS